MSNLHNENLLEDLYDQAMAELKSHDYGVLNFADWQWEKAAEKLARQRFEEMCE